MKKRFVYGILAALAVCSCQVEEINETTPESTPEVIREAKVFTAIIDDTTTPETRTSLDAEGNVLWKQGDQVSVFAGSTVNEQYQVTDASDGKTAASLNKVGDSGFVAGTEIDNNVAFYPYASTAAIAKSAGSYVISDITLSATQTYAEGSFGNGAFPMAAVTGSTGDMNLKFKNVLGGLKLQLKGTASIASISITGNNNEVLCGAAEVTVANGNTPSINLTDASAKTVTLDCGAGVALDSETATPFIIALPPITMAGGFTVIVTDTEGKQMEIKTTKSQTITRSSLLKMPAVLYEGIESNVINGYEYVDLGLRTMWATCNIGAASSEEIGNNYSWGETETKSTFSLSTYKWYDTTTETYTKYNDADFPEKLEVEDDAAAVILGGEWVTPTYQDWKDLRSLCSWSLSSLNGKYGYLVTSIVPGYTDKSIFLPMDPYGNIALGGYICNVKYMTSDYADPNYHDCAYLGLYYDYGSGDNSYKLEYANESMVWENYLVRPVIHRDCNHNLLDYQPGRAPTTLLYGYREYYKCRICGRYFEDSAGEIQIEDLASWMASGGAGYLARTEEVYIDLGLSIKWATCNLGASLPEEYGNYYAWGETSPKETYSSETYKWNEAPDYNDNYPTKYNAQDGKTVLDLEDDAAYANLGNNWRTPTIEEWMELIDNCTARSSSLNGIKGTILTSKIDGYTDKQLFLPDAGYYHHSKDYHSYLNTGSHYYMTSSLVTDYNTYFQTWVGYDSGKVLNGRGDGLPIRPVFD